MSLLQPPTDNLYKFLAISGLLLLGFFQVFPLLQLRELRNERIQISGEISILRIDLEHLRNETNRQYDANDSMIKAMEKRTPQDSFWKSEKAYIDFMVSEYKYVRDKQDQAYEKRRLIETRIAQIDTKNELLEQVGSDIKYLRFAAFGGSIVAIVIGIWGFKLWYRKVQAPQDRIIARQASEENKKQVQE